MEKGKSIERSTRVGDKKGKTRKKNYNNKHAHSLLLEHSFFFVYL
jgi:hypothetical protein